ncbi:Lac2 protein [Abortiporus biennis]|nr:Lac2 protein [Abortiporus biennis]
MAFSRSSFAHIATLLFLISATHAAIGPVTDIHLTNGIINPAGTPRNAVLVDGSMPGPLIKGNKGDNFQINVINTLTDQSMLKSTSIHWHGLFQAGTNWADGVSFVNQCPIVSNDSFLYNFNARNQAGTYWYHSHYHVQYCDGLRGPLIIYDPDDPQKQLYDVDDDSTVISLADWYNKPAPQLALPAKADVHLINGKGRVSGGNQTLSVFSVERGKRYRMRLINMSCDPNYIFSIDQHDMTIIEVDGVNTQSLTVDSIQIHAAQRYSFILNANQPVGNYWIRAKPNTGVNVTTDGGVNSAILRYVGAPEEEPTTPLTISNTPLIETNLRPLVYTPVPGVPQRDTADVSKVMQINFAAGKFTVNNVTFDPPALPVLLQVLSGTQPASIMPSGSVYDIPKDAIIELSFPGAAVAGGNHPIHLHGHNFWVIRSAGSDKYNYNDPIIRDVVSIGGANDNVTIRFKADNPGPWFLHCHIDFHLEAGFAVVFAEDVADTALANPVPAAWTELCPKYAAVDPGDR